MTTSREGLTPRLVIVAPAYNEERDLPIWLESLKHSPWRRRVKQLIIVDDGSTDRTALLAKSYKGKLPITLISYRPNRGPGVAFRRGLIEAMKRARDHDVIVTVECDNTSDLAILSQMILKLKEGAGVCVASYYTRGGGFTDVSWWRILVSEIGNLLIRFGCGIKGVRTYSSFFRVYRPAALRRLSRVTNGRLFIENGFACVVELLARLSALGEELAEVPMVLVGSKRQGKSKMRQIPTALGYFRVVLQYRR